MLIKPRKAFLCELSGLETVVLDSSYPAFQLVHSFGESMFTSMQYGATFPSCCFSQWGAQCHKNKLGSWNILFPNSWHSAGLVFKASSFQREILGLCCPVLHVKEQGWSSKQVYSLQVLFSNLCQATFQALSVTHLRASTIGCHP